MARRQHEEEQPAVEGLPVDMPEAQEASPLAPVSTLAELAKRHAQLQAAPIAGDHPYKADHVVADTMHGWTFHKLYVGTDVTLSDADYLAALEAARTGKRHAAADKGRHSKEDKERMHTAALEAKQREAAAKGAR